MGLYSFKRMMICGCQMSWQAGVEQPAAYQEILKITLNLA